jgi:EAL domain-containing protein (putative c-di-GMP-specific phosphodiesterase class I)
MRVPIDRLGQLVRQKARRVTAGTNAAKITVTASPVQPRHPEFVTRVLEMINNTGPASVRLGLETSEKGRLVQSIDVRDRVVELSLARTPVMLDELATESSPLQCLDDYRSNLRRIDRSFVTRHRTDEECDHLVLPILCLACAMKFSDHRGDGDRDAECIGSSQ